tara:strand:+ start:2986 stop:3186 length:201 start_codon:yes stop_codon:yes gene_type:complete
MSQNIKIILVIVFGIIALYIFNINSDYNLKRTISSCIVAHKSNSESFDIEKVKKLCEKEIKKMVKD